MEPGDMNRKEINCAEMLRWDQTQYDTDNYAEEPRTDMKTAAIVLLSALGVGVLGDVLFNDAVFKSVPWGLSVLVQVTALSVVSIALAIRTKLPSRRKNLLFLIPAMMLAAGCAWRDSMVLRWLDVGGIVFFFCIASVSLQGCQLATSGLSQYALTLLCALQSLIEKPIELFFQDVHWNNTMSESTKARCRSVLRGAALALPLLLIFGGLFVSADAAFEGLIRSSFKWDGQRVWEHSIFLLMAVWTGAGFLYGISKGRLEELRVDELRSKCTALGGMEVGIILGSLNALFLAFVVVQERYFFGGAALVELTNGLTFAAYARRGFFELVTVASLLLPLLLFLNWAAEKTTRVGMIVVRALTATLIVLLFVVMDSAVSRMMLYQAQYGLTELRVYTTAFMVWLAIVCGIFLVTVLRGQRKLFAVSSVISGAAVILGLHAVNPDALIVQTNLAHAKEGKTFDALYANSLSQDAFPVIIANIDRLSTGDKELTRVRMIKSYEHAWSPDWRAWNLSRNQAYHAVSAYLRNSTRQPVESSVRQ
jgi:hypothetical protein